MIDDPDKFDLEKLRRRAEKVVKGKAPESELKLSESEMLKLINELEVYRIELKMLQDELVRSEGQNKDMTRKYDELSELHNQVVLRVIRGQKQSGA